MSEETTIETRSYMVTWLLLALRVEFPEVVFETHYLGEMCIIRFTSEKYRKRILEFTTTFAKGWAAHDAWLKDKQH